MCGIIGINESNNPLIQKAAETFAYRGPDDFDIFSDERVTLGYHRLAIIDLDARAMQPMADAAQRVRIVYNGEIYNFQSVKEELRARGYSFRTTSDTEVLLYAYKEWGIGLVEHVEGMYAFAIYDSLQKKILLFTDRENIKPIFYAQAGGVFTFASDLKGVAKVLKGKGVPLSVDPECLDLYRVLGYVPAPRTLYKEIQRMDKRSILEFDLERGVLSERAYHPRTPRALSEDDFKSLLERKVSAHLVADVPVGVFFSGGTDSSLIVSILHELGVALETFSVRVEERGGDRRYFEAIAKHLGIHAHTYDFGLPEFEESYRRVMPLLGEPLADNSLLPTYWVSRKAAERVKVVLSGEGGDELFFGYPRSPVLRRLDQRLDLSVGFAERLFFVLPRFKAKNKLFERLFIVLRRPIAFYLLTMCPGRDFLTLAAWRTVKKEIAEKHVRPADLDRELYLENDLLRKTDLATMYASLEGRVPLLDLDIVASAQGTPQFGGASAELKPFLKKILARYLPRELVYRPKSGFGLKLGVFFRSSPMLKDDLRAALRYLSEHGFLPRGIRPAGELMEKHQDFCWQLIVLYYALKNVEAL